LHLNQTVEILAEPLPDFRNILGFTAKLGTSWNICVNTGPRMLLIASISCGSYTMPSRNDTVTVPFDPEHRALEPCRSGKLFGKGIILPLFASMASFVTSSLV
jgi:hypothetical protein